MIRQYHHRIEDEGAFKEAAAIDAPKVAETGVPEIGMM